MRRQIRHQLNGNAFLPWVLIWRGCVLHEDRQIWQEGIHDLRMSAQSVCLNSVVDLACMSMEQVCGNLHVLPVRHTMWYQSVLKLWHHDRECVLKVYLLYHDELEHNVWFHLYLHYLLL